MRTCLLALLLLTLHACSGGADTAPSSAPEQPPPLSNPSQAASPAPPAAAEGESTPQLRSYDRVLSDLATRRQELAAQLDSAGDAEARSEVLATAREIVFGSIVEEIIPRWYGTPWDYYGTTEVPGEGLIACGYFVSTVLRDAGFQVERVTLAQQPSEWIVKTFSTEDDIWRYRGRAASVVAEQVRGHGDGLYVVGLDIHVGFLVVQGETVEFCDASFLEEAVVTCQSARHSPSFASSYRVVGKLLSDRMLQAWLTQQPIPTHPRGDLGR